MLEKLRKCFKREARVDNARFYKVEEGISEDDKDLPSKEQSVAQTAGFDITINKSRLIASLEDYYAKKVNNTKERNRLVRERANLYARYIEYHEKLETWATSSKEIMEQKIYLNLKRRIDSRLEPPKTKDVNYEIVERAHEFALYSEYKRAKKDGVLGEYHEFLTTELYPRPRKNSPKWRRWNLRVIMYEYVG